MTRTGQPGQEPKINPAAEAVTAGRRLYYLDNLRAVSVLAVLLLHTCITYMVAAPPWWYVVDPDQSLVFTVIVLVVDVPVMAAMFLVAGYFAMPSLRRRGRGGFVREKLTRIGVPWVFGVVILAPALTYLSYVSRGIPMPYLQFWTTDFWGPRYQQSVYWFLGVLLALFLLLVIAVQARPSLAQRSTGGGTAPWRALAVVFVAAVAGAAAAAPFFGLDDWQPVGWLLMIQPARAALYPAFFVLGVHAERQGWLAGDGWRPHVRIWIPAAVIAGVAYVGFRAAGYSTTIGARIEGGVLFVAFCLAAVLAAVAGFSRWVDSSARAWRTLADNAFGIYYVHPLVLYPGALLLLGVAMPGPLKATVLLAVTIALSLAISAGILRKAPILRRAF